MTDCPSSTGIVARFLAALAVVAPAGLPFAQAEVTVYTTRGEWYAAAGPVTTLDFTGFPNGTFITDQYADLDAVFTDGHDNVYYNPSFKNDGVGLVGSGDIVVAFDRPRFSIAAEYPGLLGFRLFSHGEMIHESAHGGGGNGHFAGLVSTEPFDVVVMSDPPGAAEIDDLHFGPARCAGDVNADAVVGFDDFLELLAAWGPNPGHPADLDGDGLVGVIDFLGLLANWGPCHFFVDCNSNGVHDFLELAEGTAQDCNLNAVLDECDIADGTSSDFNGNGVPDECDLTNDDCADAVTVADGSTVFDTYTATASFPSSDCGQPLDDVWFRYTATCLGYATFSLCNAADFDTFMAVYSGSGCPPSFFPAGCSDDADGCGLTSQVTVLVIPGNEYVIRVGSLGEPAQGSATLTISCAPLAAP